MKPTQELEDFLSNIAFDLLKQLTPEKKPLWGEMNAQQMVEHLGLAVEVSSGKRDMQLHTEKEKVEKLKKIILLSDRPLPRDFMNPALPPTPLPLLYKDLKEALLVLKQSLDLFMHYYTNNVETTRTHNVFGELNYQEWLWFHYKHFIHHFIQFGLLPDTARIS